MAALTSSGTSGADLFTFGATTSTPIVGLPTTYCSMNPSNGPVISLGTSGTPAYTKITLNLDAGNDTVYLDNRVPTPILINGGDGNDTLIFSNFGRITVDLLSNTTTSSKITFSGIENVTTGIGNDTLIGNNDANVLKAGDGADVIFGGGGNDILDGGKGNDLLDGGAGDDILLLGDRTGSDIDVATGGLGHDAFIIADVVGVPPPVVPFTDPALLLAEITLGNSPSGIGKLPIALAKSAAGMFFLNCAVDVTMNLLSSVLAAKAVDHNKMNATSDSVWIKDYNPVEDSFYYKTDADYVYSQTDQSSGDLLLLADQNSQNTGGVLARIHFDDALVSTLATASGLSSMVVRKQLAEEQSMQVGFIKKVGGALLVGSDQTLANSDTNFISVTTNHDTTGDFQTAVSRNMMSVLSAAGASASYISTATLADLNDMTLGATKVANAMANGQMIVTLGGPAGTVQSGADITAITNQHTIVLSGSGGNDFLYGGAAQSDNTTSSDRAIIFGWAGDDLLVGTRGNDLLNGGDGNDFIQGGGGNDVLTGGSGSDSFCFEFTTPRTTGIPTPVFGNDTVTDFDADPAGGQDHIVLKGMNVNGFIAHYHYTVLNGNTIVSFDGGGAITFVGVTGVGANTIDINDFVFQ